ncbi:MAG: hypothetical protein Q9227_005488 [Pyrenula ochraceoflavens]
MSGAPPPSHTSGNLPNGRSADGARPLYKPAKAKTADPLFRGNKRKALKPGAPQKALNATAANGHTVTSQNGLHRPPETIANTHSAKSTNNPLALSGFSDPATTNGTFQDYKIITTKRDLVEGLRHHVLKFISDQTVNLYDQNEFLRPVRFHRRDPKAQQLGIVKEGSQDVEMNEEEKTTREEISKRKEARQKEREANLAQIAPSANSNQRLNNFKKKTAMVYRAASDQDAVKRRQIQYEEKLPWHIEDDADKHCYVGQYQGTQSNTHAALSLESDPISQTKRFRLIPLEKMYKFAPKSTRTALSIEEAEKVMKKQSRDPEFLRRAKENDIITANREYAKESRKLYSGPKGSGAGAAGLANDDEDMDYEAEASDDEDGAGKFEEKDEDQKFAERRIKQDQLKANFFGNKDEKEYDQEEEMERLMKERDRMLNKDTNKALRKREGNYNMASDSESDPFAESESSETEDEIKKETHDDKPIKEEGGSGASTRGTNTPAGRKEKHGSDRDRHKKSKLTGRSGSPNQSEASGAESTASTRKHLKKAKLANASSTQPTSQPPSRPTSPGIPSSSAPDRLSRSSDIPTSKKRKSGLGNAGSDSDGAATSDGGRKRTKLSGNPNGTIASRPGSPPLPQRQSTPVTPGPFPTGSEISSVIPAQGIGTTALIKLFKGRAHAKDVTRFVDTIKKVAKYDKVKQLWLKYDNIKTEPQ